LIAAEETSIFFESPHRLKDLLETLSALVPDRGLAVCRDLTKQSEHVLRGTAGEIDIAEPAGEYTLVLAPAEPRAKGEDGVASEALLAALIAEGVPPSTLAKALRRTGMGRSEAYDLAQRLKPVDQ